MSRSLVSTVGGHLVFGDAVSRIAESLSPLGAAGRVIAESYALVSEMRRINLEKTQAADAKEITLALLERRRQESSESLRQMQAGLGQADLSARDIRRCMVNMQAETVKPGLELAERRAYIELTQHFTTMLVQHHSDLTGGVALVVDKVLNGTGATALVPATRTPNARKAGVKRGGDRGRRR
ncbi:hypothetical protein [Amycolatopsis sp. CA-128772]|uniref:hypothetical protein n=1 Tax=Amycolatopsis sp. CA-128772 TaxID=2073159 RepID=UPI000CD126AE|nr:hypothetical protein [Amycolatopsis sp. CA-128772]